MAKTLNYNIYFLFLLLSLLLQNSSISINVHAIRYTVTVDMDPNSDGAIFFNNEIGSDFAVTVMQNITSFIYQVFNQSEGERYVPEVVSLRITDFDGYGIQLGDNINISGTYIGSPAYRELGHTPQYLFTSVMHHEMTHVFQWKGKNYNAPSGLIEGIADYVMVKSGIYLTETFTKPGVGKKWDEGYGVTERFLEYCDSLTSDGQFVAKLNKKMRYDYNVSYFQGFLGKDVNQLWTEYKDLHGNIVDDGSDDDSDTWPAKLKY